MGALQQHLAGAVDAHDTREVVVVRSFPAHQFYSLFSGLTRLVFRIVKTLTLRIPRLWKVRKSVGILRERDFRLLWPEIKEWN